MVITIIGAISLVTALSILLYVKWKLSYWRRKGLENTQPEFFFSNILEVFRRGLALDDQFNKLYNHIKSNGLKHGGLYMFTRPVYLPIDLEIIKNILQKDFSHFVNHGLFHVDEEIDPLTANLFNSKDDNWRNLRTRMQPAFTSGKIKMLFETVNNCSAAMVDVLDSNPVDIKDVVGRYVTDVICSYAFGVECNSVMKPNTAFRRYGKTVFEISRLEEIRLLLLFMLPNFLLKLTGLKQFSMELANFFTTAVKKTVNHRQNNNVQRKDFFQLLMELSKKETSAGCKEGCKDVTETGVSLTFTEMTAHCFGLLLAGYETSTTTITLALLELAINQDIQERLRDNVHNVLKKHKEVLSYDAVMEMTYLDKVVLETLRKHPPLVVLMRVCNKEYKVPKTAVVIEPGTTVFIPSHAIQNDPDIYPDPDKFDPDRFSPENKSNRPSVAFLAFGEGPRICIASRLAQLQVKLGLLSIIRNFNISLNENTRLPTKRVSVSFIASVDGGLWLNLKKISNDR